MTHVTFYNPGELDIRALQVFGLNAKETNSPIGFFGTGLKYAIAVLLRTGHEIEIEIGGNTWYIQKAKRVFRDSEYTECQLVAPDGNADPLPFTTELGKNWKVWMAYRELYSNALDEGGGVGENPSSGTIIRVYGEQICETHKNRQCYFILADEAPKMSNEEVEIHPTLGEKRGGNIFCQGILVKKLIPHARYAYNFKDRLPLSEDRELIFDYSVRDMIGKFYACNCDDAAEIDKFLTDHDGYESKCSPDLQAQPSALFLSRFDKLMETRTTEVREDIRYFVREYRNEPEFSVEDAIELDPFARQQLNQALEFVRVCGLCPEKYNFAAVKTEGDLWGFVLPNQDTVFINIATFERGVAALATTLYEEISHLETGYHDGYALQKHYLQKIIDLSCRLHNMPL